MTAALARSLPLLPQTGAAVMARGKSYIGLRETSSTLFPRGNVTPFGAWYEGGRFQGQPWCAIFVSYVTAEAGVALPIQTEYGYSWTVAGMEFFKRAGAWLPREATPPRGSHVFMSWNGDDIPEHVGLWDAPHQLDAGRSGWVLEGNASMGDGGPEGVNLHRRDRSVILGFGVPHYAPAPVAPHLAPAGHQPPPAPLWRHDGYQHTRVEHGTGLLPYSPDREVVHAQRLLLRSGRNLIIDGRFGDFTDQAVRLFQHRAGCLVDGVIGPVTWAALHAAKR